MAQKHPAELVAIALGAVHLWGVCPGFHGNSIRTCTRQRWVTQSRVTENPGISVLIAGLRSSCTTTPGCCKRPDRYRLSAQADQGGFDPDEAMERTSALAERIHATLNAMEEEGWNLNAIAAEGIKERCDRVRDWTPAWFESSEQCRKGKGSS